MEIFNLLNLLNSSWGESNFPRFNNFAIWDIEGYTDDGRPIIEFDDGELDEFAENREDQFDRSDLNSRWQMKFGIRYTF